MEVVLVVMEKPMGNRLNTMEVLEEVLEALEEDYLVAVRSTMVVIQLETYQVLVQMVQLYFWVFLVAQVRLVLVISV
jgi:hypothetical protein